MPERLDWTFERNLGDVGLRAARALEYTAHYLDRIEGHLGRIATAMERGTGNELARRELAKIAEAIQRHR